MEMKMDALTKVISIHGHTYLLMERGGFGLLDFHKRLHEHFLLIHILKKFTLQEKILAIGESSKRAIYMCGSGVRIYNLSAKVCKK